ncbi:response regulator [Magnetococcales bacterium HHB-1]
MIDDAKKKIVLEKLQASRRKYASNLSERILAAEDLWHGLLEVWVEDQARALLRLIHNLAGSSGTFGFTKVGEIAFEIESILKIMIEDRFKNVENRETIEKKFIQLKRICADALGEGTIDKDVGEKIAQRRRIDCEEIPYRILIVDDSLPVAEYTALILEGAQMESRVIDNPSEILLVMDQFKPDLVLMDLHMPDYFGPEVARIIKQQERFMMVPIVYLSGERDLDQQLEAMRAGGDGFLTKPIEVEPLISMVSSCIQRARDSLNLK